MNNSYIKIFILFISITFNTTYQTMQCVMPTVTNVGSRLLLLNDTELVKTLAEQLGKYGAPIIIGAWILTRLQQNNSSFISFAYNIIRMPITSTKKHLEHLIYGCESLDWNTVAAWNNRFKNLVTPLTKQTNLIDLQKDRRLKLIDQEANPDLSKDDEWLEHISHIKLQCNFMIKTLRESAEYYRIPSTYSQKHISKSGTNHTTTQQHTNIIKKITDSTHQSIQTIKNNILFLKNTSMHMLRSLFIISYKRNSEIVLYMEELAKYIEEFTIYCDSVQSFATLDKERIKRSLVHITATFKHLATIIDENVATRNSNGYLSFNDQSSTYNQSPNFEQYTNSNMYSSSI